MPIGWRVSSAKRRCSRPSTIRTSRLFKGSRRHQTSRRW
jgi:hypothetical protein